MSQMEFDIIVFAKTDNFTLAGNPDKTRTFAHQGLYSPNHS